MDDEVAVLVDDLVEEVLLRFPPDDPACLVRAALVCKGWCRLISGTGFRHRFRKFHGTQFMLGFLCNPIDDDASSVDERFIASFVPRSSRSRRPRRRLVGWQVFDSRHGRVLLDNLPGRMMVWDPITNERVELPELPQDPDDPFSWGWNATVLCAKDGGGGCDSLDCHRSPFLVVFVGTMPSSSRAFARVYSSEDGTWREMITSNITDKYLLKGPCALAGNNALYFKSFSRVILKFGLTTRRISEILLPVHTDPFYVVLAANQDGGLELAEVVGSRLLLWSREADLDEYAGWTQTRVIELETLLPTKAFSTRPYYVLGFATDGVGVIFLQAYDGVFTIYLNSDKVTKVEGFGVEKESRSISVSNILPYVNFYTPYFNRHV